jgi:hypothetical protein
MGIRFSGDASELQVLRFAKDDNRCGEADQQIPLTAARFDRLLVSLRITL